MKKSKIIWICCILLIFIMVPYLNAQDNQNQDGKVEERITPDGKNAEQITKNPEGIIVYNLTLDERRNVRKQITHEFINIFNENHVFAKIAEYMASVYKDSNKTPRYPDVILQDTLDKAGNLIVQTRKFVGSSFSKVYEPDQIEKKVQKYLWLKGLCFFALGITDEHRLAVSYFYLPGNEAIRRDFLRHVVRFSFPEVPDLPENKAWQDKMSLVMDRLGYEIFSIKKFNIARNDLTP